MIWSTARHVLCVRLDTIGDVLMTTPALRAIKEGRSDRRVTLLTSTPGAAVARRIPELDDVLIYEAPWLKATAPRRDSGPDHEFVAKLRELGFDAAVIFTVYSQSALPAAMLTYLADVPLRLAHARENPYQLLTDWVKETEPEGGVRHEVRRQLDLVATVGCHPSHPRLSLRPTADDRFHAAAELSRCGISSDSWAVVHPGATASSRRYPPESFMAVVRSLVSDYGVEIVFTGSRDEAELIETIRAGAGVRTHSLAGRLSLGELAAVIDRAPVLISNNTGPAHIAAAMNTPVVDLYALTNPQHTPWLVASRVLNREVPCAPCYRSVCPERLHPCLRGVPPGDVVEATLELLHGACLSSRDRSCQPSTS
jgi:lipopolysaccharide heptosyltransferase II